MMGGTLTDDWWETRLRVDLKYNRRATLQSDSPFASVWMLHYPVGMSYIYEAYRSGGTSAVQALFQAPPLSTIYWMLGYEESRGQQLFLPLACNDAAAPEGYEWYALDSLGPLTLGALLAHLLVTDEGVIETEEHWRNAMRWRQDSMTIFSGPDGETAVSYRVRFDDDAIAGSIATALEGVTVVDLAVRRHEAEIEILAATDPGVISGWETDPAACPERSALQRVAYRFGPSLGRFRWMAWRAFRTGAAVLASVVVLTSPRVGHSETAADRTESTERHMSGTPALLPGSAPCYNPHLQELRDARADVRFGGPMALMIAGGSVAVVSFGMAEMAKGLQAMCLHSCDDEDPSLAPLYVAGGVGVAAALGGFIWLVDRLSVRSALDRRIEALGGDTAARAVRMIPSLQADARGGTLKLFARF